MTVVNREYNFNFPNMNFGQSMLYGLFGSLTGGMGMNGSIFSMMGIGNCGFGGFGYGGYGMGGYGYSDQMMGMQIGSTLFNFGLSALSNCIESRSAKKEALSTSQNNIEVLTSEISDLEDANKKLMDSNVAKVIKNDGKVDSSVKAVLPTQSTKYIDSYKALKTLKEGGFENSTYFKSLTDDQKVDKNGTEYNKQLNSYNNKIEELNTQTLNDLNALNEAIEKEIASNNEKIEKKKADLEKAQKALEEAVSSSVKIKKKCDSDGEYSEITKSHQDSNKNYIFGEINDKNAKDFVAAFNYKFSKYCNASKAEKLELAKEGIALFNHIENGHATSITSTMKRNKEIMESGKKAFGLDS